MEPLPDLASLIAQANRLSGPSIFRVISDHIMQANRDEADPYVLAGVLVEGIAMTLTASIPEQKRNAVASDVLKLMCNRFLSLGMLEPPKDR